MKIFLIDDESPALGALEGLLKTFPGVEVAGKYISPLRALENMKKARPDIVFLDIEMPEMNGFLVAEEILQIDSSIMIVFVTAYDEYALKAFEISAVDYVLKPCTKERLQSTLSRISMRIGKQPPYEGKALQSISHQALKQGIKKVPVWKDERIFLISPGEILYCSAGSGEVSLVLRQDSIFKSSHSLDLWEEKLKPYKFFRCHRSFLVNMEKIDEIIPDINSTYSLKMRNLKEEIPVSRSYLKVFRKLVGL
jgi:DNA-binding LytR/AlgR family response regulator